MTSAVDCHSAGRCLESCYIPLMVHVLVRDIGQALPHRWSVEETGSVNPQSHDRTVMMLPSQRAGERGIVRAHHCWSEAGSRIDHRAEEHLLLLMDSPH